VSQNALQTDMATVDVSCLYLSTVTTHLVNMMLMHAFGRWNVSSCRYQTLDSLQSCITVGTGDGCQHIHSISYQTRTNKHTEWTQIN